MPEKTKTLEKKLCPKNRNPPEKRYVRETETPRKNGFKSEKTKKKWILLPSTTSSHRYEAVDGSHKYPPAHVPSQSFLACFMYTVAHKNEYRYRISRNDLHNVPPCSFVGGCLVVLRHWPRLVNALHHPVSELSRERERQIGKIGARRCQEGGTYNSSLSPNFRPASHF